MEDQSVEKRILVLIATYNEAENIASLVRQVLGLADTFDILLIDDNSPDGTGKIIEGLYRDNKRVKVIIRRGERGRGLASLVGYEYFRGCGCGYLCELDADFQEDPKDMLKLIETAQKTGCDMVIGSRYVQGGGFESGKKYLSLLARFLMSLLFKTGIKDATNWFHLINRSVFDKVDHRALRSRGFFLAAELHLSAEMSGLDIKEVPIFFPSRAKGKTKIDLRVVVGFAKEALRFKFGSRIKK